MLEFKIRMALFMAAFIILVDVYSWQAIKTLVRNNTEVAIRRLRNGYFTATLLFIVLFVSQLMVPFLEASKMVRIYAGAFVFVIYLSKLVICIFLLVDDLQRLPRWLFKLLKPVLPKRSAATGSDESAKISRAKFISQAGTITAAVPLIMLTKGIFKGAYDYRVIEVPLYLPNLPSAFNGLKVLQVSDIHSGSFFNKDAVKKGVDMIRNAKADLIFFTGDLVNSKTDEAYDYADIFSAIQAPMGVFSTFGNHDYGDYIEWPSKEAKEKNLADLVQVHKDLGWHLMRNEHVTLDRNNQRIGLLGVENWGDRGRFQKFGDIDKARNGLPDVPVKLLLSHDPSHFDSIISTRHKDIDVTFAGHTHGFQFGIEIGNIKWSPSQYIYPHWAGLYREGSQQLYVNRGFGFLGYPGRVGILPEITVFTLTNA
jgi:predicted MPP superfamily phosphohydrolase